MSSIIVGFFERNDGDAPSFDSIGGTNVYKRIYPKDDLFLVVIEVSYSEYHCRWTHEVCDSTLGRDSIYPRNYAFGE